MIEIEKRGPLTKKQYVELQKFLISNAKLTGKYNQIGIFSTFKNERNKNQINISISQDILGKQTRAKLKAKLGDLKSTARKEISIPFDIKEIQSIFDFLEVFGVKDGCPRFYYREDYVYNGITVSIKNGGLLEDHFETEVEVENEFAKDEAELKLIEFTKELGIEIWEEDTYQSLIKKVFDENPPIDFAKIDLSIFE